MLAFYKDFSDVMDDDCWMVVIVQVDEGETTGEVVDALRGTKAECRAFAFSYIGPPGPPVYVAPTIQ